MVEVANQRFQLLAGAGLSISLGMKEVLQALEFLPRKAKLSPHRVYFFAQEIEAGGWAFPLVCCGGTPRDSHTWSKIARDVWQSVVWTDDDVVI